MDPAATHVCRGFVLWPGTRVEGGEPRIQLAGRLEDGRSFLVEETRFRPYFFAAPGAACHLPRDASARVEPSPLRALDGAPVERITVRVPADVPALRARLLDAGLPVYEADVRFVYRFLVDRGLRGGVEIRGEPRVRPDGVLHFVDPELAPASVRPQPTVLSIDIETDPEARAVFAIALVGAGADEVHLVGGGPVAGAIVHADEAALLRACVERVRALDPDVITGWNVVDFDLRVLLRRARARRVDFDLGRVAGPVLLRDDPGFTRQRRAEIPGRMVLDGLGLVRDAGIKLDDYRLETAAQALLGRGKRIDDPGPGRGEAILEMYERDPEALVAYNREDARLVLDLLEQERLVELAVERSLLCGMQLDRVGASIASFDLLYLPELRRRGRVAPSVDRERKAARVTGGAVLDSRPGLASNVAVFDFKSLYPSLIRTFNLDPLAHAQAGDDPILAPNGAAFSREGGILPELLEDFFEHRRAARERGDRHADLAIKIMMNSLFGVLGAASCRFFDPGVANAITLFGQRMLGWTREAFAAEQHEVVYGDTDSVFVALGAELAPDAARECARELQRRVQAAIAERVRSEYRVEPRLELELERVYERFFMPTVRGGAQGSKKRYAGWLDGRVHVVGLEAVRSDWPALAGRLQVAMLERVFRGESPVPLLRETLAALKSGASDRELVYRKRLRKGSAARYTASTPPHVEAARRAGAQAGRDVRYVITRGGPEPVLPGRPFPDGIDHDHYVEKVVRPVAESILAAIGERFEEAADLPRQLDLL